MKVIVNNVLFFLSFFFVGNLFLSCDNKEIVSDKVIIDDMEYQCILLDKKTSDNREIITLGFRITWIDKNTSPLKRGVNSYEEFDKRINYSLTEIKKDFKIIVGSESLYPKNIVFEYNNGLTNFETYILVFEIQAQTEKIYLHYTDELFNNGIIKFKI